ncbi:hypothetical protein M426DRAFT_259234 [Hypoxylon sp. CI-4A]|nr:hypothetical protein M426DRAFT_259234 [Hypoxylon sp. CI-4A]
MSRRGISFFDVAQQVLQMVFKAKEGERAAERQQRSRPAAETLQARRRGVIFDSTSTIRDQIRDATANRIRVPDERLRLLALRESVVLNTPEHPAPSLRPRITARLCRYFRDGKWWFLGDDGFFYRSSDPYARLGSDLEFIIDLHVPISVRIIAEPYKHLCHRWPRTYWDGL